MGESAVEAVLSTSPAFAEWRRRARDLLAAGIAPSRVLWRTAAASPDLFAPLPEDGEDAGEKDAAGAAGDSVAPRQPVSRRFLDLGKLVICHADPGRLDLLYHLLWRLTRGGEAHLLADASDPLVRRAERMAAEVRREVHRMHAFVRFRAVGEPPADPVYVAWFEPAHPVLARAAPFFVERFAGQRWSILTPAASVHWDGVRLIHAPGQARRDAPGDDGVEDMWRRYYASIFNPARVNPRAMQAQMPKRFWPNLPEAAAIPGLLAGAGERTRQMIEMSPAPPRRRRRAATAAPGGVDRARNGDVGGSGDTGGAGGGDPGGGGDAPTVGQLAAAARSCRACPLWEPATQTVFGEGPSAARLVLIGEQPGDQEDLAGRPFVGPAGQLLDRALAEAGIDRGAAYVTNAVKHFKYVVRGKRRLHQKPSVTEIEICTDAWLRPELAALDPALVVLMGATAARAVLGRDVVIGRSRGRVMREGDRALLVTVHPSYLLRLPDAAAREREYDRFVADLRLAAPYAA